PATRRGRAVSDGMRVGIGFDAHAFAEGRRLILAGVEGAPERGLEGGSGGDPVSPAGTEALLRPRGGGDIGAPFPSGDPAVEDAASIELLRRAWSGLAAHGWSIVNVDAVVVMQSPRLAPHREAMRATLADALGVGPDRVTVRASTTDMLGFVGRGE